jgi:hypothetical protein
MKILTMIVLIIGAMALFTIDAGAKYDPLARPNNIYGMHITNHSDLADVAALLNTGGGDWGYVTVVITASERDKITWQNFFEECRRLHIIPIIRIATKPENSNWQKPDLNDIDNWVNFFNSLNWVIENRYVVIGNEPNHSKEWGGEINPEEYGIYLKTFSQRLKNSNPDYFVLPAGFDQAANNSKQTMDEKLFISKMYELVPDIFEHIDGWNSHSYPNPDFAAEPQLSGRKSIRGYDWETTYIKSLGVSKDFPVFITETGWDNEIIPEDKLSEYFEYAYKNVWTKDEKIVAVTPFIFNYTHKPFSMFSWKKEDGSFYKYYDVVKQLPKIKGVPRQIIDGKIIFKFLSSTAYAGAYTKGYLLVENTGQNIWNTKNVYLVNEGADMAEISEISLKEIYPFEGRFIGYTLTYPKTEGEKDLKIGLFVEEKRIGDAFDGKIYSYVDTESLREIVFNALSKILRSMPTIRS